MSAYNGSAWVDICPAGTVSAGTWSHVAYVYNGTNIYGYVNGSLCGSAAFTYTNNVAHHVYIGSWYSPVTYYDYNGLMDEVRLSSIARSSEEIRLDAQRRPYGIYTSPVLNLTSVVSWNSLSWSELGVATGDGETLFSSTNLVAQWNFNDTIPTNTAVSGGTCGTSCNGTLTGFTASCGISSGIHDACAGQGWTTDNGRWPASSPQALMFNGIVIM